MNVAVVNADSASYGYLSKSSVTSLKNRRRSNLPQRPKAQRRGTVTIYNDNGGTSDGQVQFWNLISQGALAKDDSGAYVGAGGFERRWDKCSSTVRTLGRPPSQ